VLPKHVKIFPVGGIGSQDIPEWLASGADGFGFGGELFKPAYTLAELTKRAQDLVQALRSSAEKN
jgi:2-dehydro-3-deoxyphosphogalactonate aldolase